MVMTRDVIAFGAPGGDGFYDVIPLSEIHRVHDCSDPGRSEGSWDVVPGMFVLTTAPTGVNSGRSYCIAAEFPLQSTGKNGEGRPALSLVLDPGAVVETQMALLKVMEALVREAQIRAKSQTLGAKFTRSRLVVKQIFMSLPLQMTVAVLLTSNFVANAAEAQMAGLLTLQDGSPTPLAKTLESMDIFFTSVFTVELLLNIYAQNGHQLPLATSRAQ